MGVKELWPLLTPVVTKKGLDEVSGQTVAIDLSLWIVDSQCVKQMVGVVTRPHLRNIFFRTVALLQADILPVFVVDGKAPEIKWQTMADRQHQRQGKRAQRPEYKPSARHASRSHFNSVIRECREMLQYLGVPVIEATGEAEAMCAALNSYGLVDAVITDDGDVFLYGARTVYRNFTTTKAPSVERFSMDDIESQLGLTREHLISIALLIGCDYCPKGVPGVGKSLAMKLCSEVGGDVILSKILHWSTNGLSGTESLTEAAVAKKMFNMKDSNFLKITKEFKHQACQVPASVGTWKKPLISKSQSFHNTKMDWPINYSLEKMLPLLTLWSFNCVSRLGGSADSLTIQPEKIIKKRVRQGVDCLEVLWFVTDPYEIDEEDEKPAQLVTVEPLQMMKKCFPAVVEKFLISNTSGKAKTIKTKKKPSQVEQQSKPSTQYTHKLQPAVTSLESEVGLSTSHPSSTNSSSVNHFIDRREDSARALDVSGVVCSNDIALVTLNLSLSDMDNSSPSNIDLDQSFDISLLSIDLPAHESSYQLKADAHSPARRKQMRRNSIDDLLEDISEQLKTPSRNIEQTSASVANCDCIIAGYFSPHSSQTQSANIGDLELSDHGKNGITCYDETDSDLSLLPVNVNSSERSEVLSMSLDSCKSNTNISHVTYGEYDLVPQFSILDCTE